MLYKKKTENEAGIVNMRHMHNNRHLKQILQTRGALNKKSRYIWGMVHAHWLIWVQTSLCFIKKWLNKGQKTAKRGVYRDAWKNHLNRDISRTNQLREKNKDTMMIVSSMRNFWYATRPYWTIFKNWPFLTFDLSFDPLGTGWFLRSARFQRKMTQ